MPLLVFFVPDGFTSDEILSLPPYLSNLFLGTGGVLTITDHEHGITYITGNVAELYAALNNGSAEGSVSEKNHTRIRFPISRRRRNRLKIPVKTKMAYILKIPLAARSRTSRMTRTMGSPVTSRKTPTMDSRTTSREPRTTDKRGPGDELRARSICYLCREIQKQQV